MSTIQSTEQISYGGGFDEEGLINNIYRKGFSINNCFTELIANCIDAKCTNILFNITKKNISIIDNGNGMNREKLTNMFSIYRSNHKEHTSLGVSGLGAKAATLILSQNKETTLNSSVYVYTKDKYTDEFLVAIIPWDQIIMDKIYTNKISIQPMTPTDKEQFINERESNEMESIGTTILFKYNEDLNNEIEKQFKPDNSLNMLDIWGVIFGKMYDIKLKYLLNNREKYPPLKMYDYFGGREVEYYTGQSKDIIKCFKHKVTNEIIYILVEYTQDQQEKYKEFTKNGSGLATTLSPCQLPNIRLYTEIGIFHILNGMRNHKELYDEENIPESLLCVFEKQPKTLCEYDSMHFSYDGTKDILQHSLGKAHLIRNHQLIGLIEIPGFKVESARGNAITRMKTTLLRTEIHYNPTSEQNNILDITMGIQENKNQ